MREHPIATWLGILLTLACAFGGVVAKFSAVTEIQKNHTEVIAKQGEGLESSQSASSRTRATRNSARRSLRS